MTSDLQWPHRGMSSTGVSSRHSSRGDGRGVCVCVCACWEGGVGGGLVGPRVTVELRLAVCGVLCVRLWCADTRELVSVRARLCVGVCGCGRSSRGVGIGVCVCVCACCEW